MRKKGRLKSEREILAMIHDCHRESYALLKEADMEEAIAKDWLKLPEMAEAGSHKMDQVRKLRERADRLIDVKAKKLGDKLSEFRTETMPFLNDKTVQAL